MEGGADSQQPTNGQSHLQVDFAIKPDTHSQKVKVKNMDEIAEERLRQTFNVGGGAKEGDELKRKREDFAVQLRKSKREEAFKAKRAFIGETAGLVQNNVDQNQQMNLGPAIQYPDDMLLQISVEDALAQAETLSRDDFITQAQRMQFHIQDFQKLLMLIHDTNDLKLIFATVGFRRLLSKEQNPPIQPVIDANLVPKFISFLQRVDFPKIQFEAAWCLTNIASGQSEQVQVLIDKGTIPVLIELLNSPHIDVVEQAIWALGNIAGDSPKVRDLVINSGAITPISNILDQAMAGTSLVRNASWTLSNLCRGRPTPPFEKVMRAIPSLAKVVIENDLDDILVDVCWAVSYLSDGGEERIPLILGTGILQRLIQLLMHQNIAISVPSLRTIGNIVTGDDDQTQYVINSGVLEALNQIIYHRKKTVRKEVCWSLSNITAGNPEQIQACLDLGIIDKLIHLLQNDEIEIKKEAVWAVSNTTAAATFEQFVQLVQKGILRALSQVLKMKEARILAVALEGIENILKAGQKHYPLMGQENKFTLELEMCGGLEEIEGLQMHPNHQIYERSLKILEKYFQDQQEQMYDVTATASQTPVSNSFNL